MRMLMQWRRSFQRGRQTVIRGFAMVVPVPVSRRGVAMFVCVDMRRGDLVAQFHRRVKLIDFHACVTVSVRSVLVGMSAVLMVQVRKIVAVTVPVTMALAMTVPLGRMDLAPRHNRKPQTESNERNARNGVNQVSKLHGDSHSGHP